MSTLRILTNTTPKSGHETNEKILYTSNISNETDKTNKNINALHDITKLYNSAITIQSKFQNIIVDNIIESTMVDTYNLFAAAINTTEIICDEIQINTGIKNSLGVIVFDPNSPPISSINGSTKPIQTFTTIGTSGAAPNWSTNTGTGAHTLNIPIAGNTVTAGLINNTTQTIYGAKTFMNNIYTSNIINTGTISTLGEISGGNLFSSTSYLNGITIPEPGGTLAKLTDIPISADNLGIYSNVETKQYLYEFDTSPQNLIFNIINAETGMRIDGANDKIRISSYGLYNIIFDGYMYTSANVQQIKIRITVNEKEVDTRVFTQSTLKIFEGMIYINSVLFLNAEDVLTITIGPDNRADIPCTFIFESLQPNEKNHNLMVRKI